MRWKTMQPATVQVPWDCVSPLEPISLDRDAEVPLGTQLTWALRARITAGTLPRGERLPGARELAAEVGVNVNTIRAVYARLEHEGLLAIVHGRGTFVSERAVAPDETARLAAAVEAEARRRGIDPRAVAAALYVGPGESGDSAGRLLTRQELEHARDRLAAHVAEAASSGEGPAPDAAATAASAAVPAAPAASTLTRSGTLRWVTG